jgi:tetratricopeptide (TPR) repeat protein
MSAKHTNRPSPTEVARPANDSNLTFIVYAGKSNSRDEIVKNIVTPLTSAKSEASLILVSNETNWENEPALAALISRQRLKIVASPADDLTARWYYVVENASACNIPDVLACFSAHRKDFDPAFNHSGIYTKKSGLTDNSWSKRLSNGIHNFIGQLFLPSANRDHTHRYNFFNHSTILHAYRPGDTQVEVLSLAAYHEIPLAEFTLTSREKMRTYHSVFKLLALGISTRFRWFVSGALAGLKNHAPQAEHPGSRLGFFAFVLFALITMCVLSFDFGISWDARRHNQYGYQMLNYFTTMGDDTACLAENSPINEFRYYGEHFNVIAAFFNTYVKVFDEFETRHLLNALYGFLAMLFAALAAKEIGNWRTGLLAFLAIYFSPVFFGHSMNNPTDIPFAAGCAMAVYYLIKILKTLPAPKLSWLILCAMGVGMAIGARIGALVLFGYAGLFMGIQWLMVWKNKGWKQASSLLVPYLRAGLIIVIAGFAFGLSLWPFGQQEIFTNWYVALKRSTDSSFFTYNHELFEGVRMYMGNVPWYYLPKFIWMNSPLLVSIGFVLLILISFRWKKLFPNAVYIPMMLFVLLFPIVYAEYQSMYYYNGWRHYLFTYPPLIVLAAVGWEGLIRLIPSRLSGYITGAVFAALLALPAVWMVRNHPNEVVYFNEAFGGVNAAYGNYETDYYSNSVREAAEWLAHHEPNRKVVVAINNEPLTGSYYATRINPKMEFMWVREYEEERHPWDYMILTSRTFSKNELLNGAFPPKGTIYTVKADDAPLAVVVKRENYFMPNGYKALGANKLDSAIWYFKQAAAYNPMDEEPYRMLGSAYMTLRSFDTAFKYFDKSIEIFPENYLSYDNKGLIYVNNREYERALPYFKTSTHLKFNNTEGYYYAAVCHYNLGNYGEGIKLLENAIKRNGAIYQTYYYLGLGYINTGNYKKAQDALSFALAYNPKSAEVYLAYAEMFRKQGMQSEYEQCMAKYRELGGR